MRDCIASSFRQQRLRGLAFNVTVDFYDITASSTSARFRTEQGKDMSTSSDGGGCSAAHQNITVGISNPTRTGNASGMAGTKAASREPSTNDSSTINDEDGSFAVNQSTAVGPSNPTYIDNTNDTQHHKDGSRKAFISNSSTINDEDSHSRPTSLESTQKQATSFTLVDTPTWTVSTGPMASYALAGDLLTSGKITREDYDKLTKLIQQDIIGTSDGGDGRVVKFATRGAVKIQASVPLPTRRCAEAAAEVLGTAELLESILLLLPASDLFCKVPLVCKGFRSVLEGSAALKRRIGRSPGHDDDPWSSPLYVELPGRSFHGFQAKSFREPPSIRVEVHPTRITKARRSRTFRETQIHNPPMRRASLTVIRFSIKEHDIHYALTGEYAFHNPEGITFGNLLDIVDRVDKSRSHAVAYLKDRLPEPLQFRVEEELEYASLQFSCKKDVGAGGEQPNMTDRWLLGLEELHLSGLLNWNRKQS